MARRQLEIAENNGSAEAQWAPSPYVPPLQRTEGQPQRVAAHGRLSYMVFDRDGDGEPPNAIEDALAEIAEGEAQRVVDINDNAPPSPKVS